VTKKKVFYNISTWNHLLPDGVFVFTSSGGVFTENSGGVVDENSAVAAAGRNKAILVSSSAP
jgi:hypothetical protein